MYYDFDCTKKGCKGKYRDLEKDILDPFPKCPLCGSEMENVSFRHMKVALKGKGFTRSGVF